ncbi:HAMP domain-containing histidine kinase [Solirubrobacter sp. CPCC 204708]|uniref:histidine kinase n=1 Tax=Solirubrobacter deserti TaxID=2282478 RepID=A0ABT4RH53_9ACTN|nr:HAMP domain-containing sensor histidine kinase [Solirubrobacter deserti]MBE2315201.1 HAMP domain-containing histidine kinase [Solirubrobacter deserti]MDA0137884.1 HAMP domain-containing histidine kinase [Solirubrobacter deserti]
MTLRARVAAAAAAAIFVALALLVVTVPKLLADDLRGELDDSLRRRAADVARLNATAPGQLTEVGAIEGGGLLVQVVDRSGRIVVRSSALGGRVLPIDQTVLRERQPRLDDGRLGTDPVRLYTAPLGELGSGEAAGGVVVVGSELAAVDRTVDRARVLIAVCALVAALIAAAFATWLTRRALRPLTRLNAGAREIGRAGDTSKRLPEPARSDEVGELAHTLNAMLASLERAQEAEHRFVGDASHELRTPLTALRGNAAFLAKHGPDPTVVQDIADDAERLTRLLDDLLALAREDAAAPLQAQPVRLADLAPDATVEHDAWTRGERDALQRAVDNLVRNAHKHGTGAVTVTVGGDGTQAWIRVEDEGPGPSDVHQIFERFHRGPDARGDGSGLGLPIVKAIAERHGGRVEVDGARFTLVLRATDRR